MSEANENLAQLQHWLARAIMHSDSVAAEPRTTSDTRAADPLAPNARLSSLAQLEIYQSGYRSRLSECLADDYPALQHGLGHAAFQALCRDYIARFPSQSPSLNGFGRRMAELCSQQALPNAACWAELARLEWAIVEVIHAADSERLPATAFTHLTPAQFGAARLEGARALRLLEQRYAVDDYYTAFRQSNASQPIPEAHTFTLVQRRALTVQRHRLSQLPALILRELLAAKPVAEALDAAIAALTADDQRAVMAETVNAAFEQLFGLGCFVRVL